MRRELEVGVIYSRKGCVVDVNHVRSPGHGDLPEGGNRQNRTAANDTIRYHTITLRAHVSKYIGNYFRGQTIPTMGYSHKSTPRTSTAVTACWIHEQAKLFQGNSITIKINVYDQHSVRWLRQHTTRTNKHDKQDGSFGRGFELRNQALTKRQQNKKTRADAHTTAVHVPL